MELHEKLKKLRQEKHKTQSELAEYLQTGQSYYAKYESGKIPLPAERLRQLCLYYHISADYFLGLPDDLPHEPPKNPKKK